MTTTGVSAHRLVTVPRSVQQQMRRESEQGLVEPSGFVPLAHWVEDGVIYCLMQAPDYEAICVHHVRRGLACDDVHLIAALAESRAVSREDQAVVRAAIDSLWHGNESR